MHTLATSLLLAISLAATPPVPIVDWTATPTGPEHAVLYTADKAGDALWSVGITLEQDGPALKFHPLAVRWDGTRWEQTTPATPDGRLDDVLVKSANDVWAVGMTEGGTGEPLVAELEDNEFVQTTTPPGAGYLHGSAPDGTCLWAVGVGAVVPGEVESPYIALGKPRADAGHGVATPGCRRLRAK